MKITVVDRLFNGMKSDNRAVGHVFSTTEAKSRIWGLSDDSGKDKSDFQLCEFLGIRGLTWETMLRRCSHKQRIFRFYLSKDWGSVDQIKLKLFLRNYQVLVISDFENREAISEASVFN